MDLSRRSLLLALGAVVVLTAAPASCEPTTQPTGPATATVETAPVLSTGDAADDPAIWRHPTDPARSVVIGNDKGGALEVYDLAGNRIQRIAEGFFGNVDVRGDLVATVRLGLRIYRIDPVTRQLSVAGQIAVPFGGEGLCLHRSAATGVLSAFVNARSGRIAQFELADTDGDGDIDGRLVRDWDVGTEVEGCVADDELGHLYVSEEEVGIWRYGAEPTAETSTADRTLVDTTVAAGGHLVPDAEGLTLVYQPGGTGYLLASSQAGANDVNFVAVYERQGANAFVRTLRVEDGPVADDCDLTDGIDALAADLGPVFPHGLFVCQDNDNDAPGPAGNQNFKLVPLERVVALQSVPPPPPPEEVVSFVGAASAAVNSTRHTVTIPGTVQPGDALLLVLGANTTAAVSDPPGWQRLDSLATATAQTRVWSRVATATDPGATVRVDLAAVTKANLAVAAYRGTDTAAPVAAFARRASSGAAHTTPAATVADPRSWVVSYWMHKDSTTTALTPPAGVEPRASGTHTGSGRVTVLLADSGGPVPAGTAGGLTATAASATNNAAAWTIVLAPAAQGSQRRVVIR